MTEGSHSSSSGSGHRSQVVTRCVCGIHRVYFDVVLGPLSQREEQSEREEQSRSESIACDRHQDRALLSRYMYRTAVETAGQSERSK